MWRELELHNRSTYSFSVSCFLSFFAMLSLRTLGTSYSSMDMERVRLPSSKEPAMHRTSYQSVKNFDLVVRVFFYSPAEDVRLRFQLPDGGKELNLPNPWTKSTRLVVNFSGCEQRTVDKHLKVSFLPNPHGEVSKLDKSIESRFQCSAMHSP